MSEASKSADDRTEEATQERRDEFREKGNVVSSRELTSVVVLAGTLAFFTFYGPVFLNQLAELYVTHFERIRDFRITPQNAPTFAREVITQTFLLIIPLFIVSASVASAITLLQT